MVRSIVSLSDYVLICSFFSSVSYAKLGELIGMILRSMSTFLKRGFPYQYHILMPALLSFHFSVSFSCSFFVFIFRIHFSYSFFSYSFFFFVFIFFCSFSTFSLAVLVQYIDSVCVDSVLELNHCDKIDAIEKAMKLDLFQD